MRQFSIPPNQLNNVKTYKLRSYERTEYSKSWKSYEHMHSHTEIFFITNGEGIFHTKEADTPIRRGMIVINTPSVPHTEYSSEARPLSYACFSVDNLSFSLPETSKQKTFFFDFSTHFDWLFHILAVIEYEQAEKPPFWQLSIVNAFNDFMLFLLRNTQLVALPFDSSVKPNLPSRIQAYLQANYQDNITLDKLSEDFFLNKYYIVHAFKKKYGVSIMQYLNQLRCTDAKRLLENTDLSITEIAISVGYNSSSHFTESYKKIIGEAPTATRKKAHTKKHK